MPLSLDQLARQLTDSGLLTADEVAALRAAAQPADAEQFARVLVKQKRLTPFQAQQAYAGKAKSLVLGNYVLLDKLGQGGMGMVLKAEHRRMKRVVALKVLSPAVTKTEALLQRFQREVQAAARLSHPNIVAAFDADEAAGTHYLVMEFVDGRDLATVVRQNGPLPVEQGIHCVLQAARGLEFAHRHGVIHRDIKPANLLLDSQGTVKILDMGLARIEGDTSRHAELTNTGTVMGTVDYMAPEQALSTRNADARSDIYSLGITLWALLVGRPAYDGDSLMARMLAHREAPLPSLVAALTQRSPGMAIPGLLDSVFHKMIAKQPAERYQSMTEVIAALEGLLRGETPAEFPRASAVSADSQFSAFLANLAADEATPHRGTQATLAPRDVGTEYAATVDLTHAEATTDPTLHTSFAAGSRRNRTMAAWISDRRVQVGMVAGVMLLGGLWFAASRGTAVAPRAPSHPSATSSTTPTVSSNDQSVRAALELIRKNGGWIEIDVQGRRQSIDNASAPPREPFQVRRIDLDAAVGLTPQDVRRLAVIPGPFFLSLPHAWSGQDAAAAAAQLPAGDPLAFGSVYSLTSATGQALGAHPVEYLIISGREVEPGSLAALRALPNLKLLLLQKCRFDRTTLAEVNQLPHLKNLNLESSTVNDDDLDVLTNRNLEDLALFGTQVTTAGLARVRQRYPGIRFHGVDALLADEFLPAGGGWTAPENLGPGINTDARDMSPSLTDDERVIVFCSGGKIREGRRQDRSQPFAYAEELPGPLNEGRLRDHTLSMTGDGLVLVFDNQPDGDPSEDIWIAMRPSLEAPFGAPQRLPEPVNTPAVERHPVLSPNGLQLALTSTRQGNGDVFLFARPSRDEAFQSQVEQRLGFNNDQWEVPEHLTSNGRGLIKSSMKPGSVQVQIYRRNRSNEAFGPGEPLELPVEATSAGRFFVAADGQSIYFHARDLPGGAGQLDLWVIRRRAKP